MTELEVLEAVESAKGKDKQRILSEHCHNPRLHELLDAALNFKRKYHIKKFNEFCKCPGRMGVFLFHGK